MFFSSLVIIPMLAECIKIVARDIARNALAPQRKHRVAEGNKQDGESDAGELRGVSSSPAHDDVAVH